MDATASDPSSPPRSRQLQGKRQPRLAVNVESLKIEKPAVTPRPKSHHLQQLRQAPAIIYNDDSTKVINVEPDDFMALVQRLTGPVVDAPDCMEMEYAGPSVVSSPPVESPPREWLLSPTAAAVSASARLAATERAVRALPLPRHPTDYGEDANSLLALAAVLSLPGRPGILSPAALPPAACSGQFSALPFDPSCFSWPKELRCVGELGCLFTLNRSTLLPGMPCPTTVSTPELFSNVLGKMQLTLPS